MFLCTPHNPASTLIARGPLRRFLDALGPDAPLVILDEAYRDFCDDPETPDGAALARDYPTVIALRTFSKIAGLAGLRVGYAIAQPPAIDRLNRVRAPYNVNRLAQVAALTALADRATSSGPGRWCRPSGPPHRSASRSRRPRAPVAGQLSPARVGPRAGAVRAALLARGILVRDGADVGFPGHLRIAIGTREQNDRLLAAWDAVP